MKNLFNMRNRFETNFSPILTQFNQSACVEILKNVCITNGITVHRTENHIRTHARNREKSCCDGSMCTSRSEITNQTEAIDEKPAVFQCVTGESFLLSHTETEWNTKKMCMKNRRKIDRFGAQQTTHSFNSFSK